MRARAATIPARCAAMSAVFFRGLRRELGEAFPYLWVPEWHPGGHGLHVHFAVGRYVKRTLIRECGVRGSCTSSCSVICRSGRGRSRRRGWRPLPGQVRRRKAVEDEREAGLHRYEVAQGFQPESIELHGPTASGCDRAGVGADGPGAVAGLALVEGGGLARAAGCWAAWSD